MSVPTLLTRVPSDVARGGGTLRLYGPGDIDHLDPAACHASTGELVRLFSRQFVTYEPQQDLRNWQAGAPVPDLAVEVPSTYNMGLGASQRSYVLHLRPEVLWDTTPVRPVTAHDFVRGFKRMGNPVMRSPVLTYFTSTIRGMSDFCAGFDAAVPRTNATAEHVAAYQNAHEIPGVFALDDETLVIEVVRPTLDFVHMLALPCASAAPAEYDAYVPGSLELRLNLRSNGPYRVAYYVPGKELTLEQNPAWRRESDPVRRLYVAHIEITVEKTSPGEIDAKIDAGEADLGWGSPSARRRLDPQTPVSYALDPYLVFNVARGSRALSDVRVRRAIAAVIDKAALADVCRRTADVDVRVAGSIIPPNNDAHDDLICADVPDPERARALLAEAGYADGLTLIAGYRERDTEPDVARSYAADLEQVGIAVRLVRLDDDAAEWDVMARSWSADWTNLNGRVFLQSLFETGGSANDGGYSSPVVDELIRRALEAAVEQPEKANAAWRDVERRVLDEVVVVPLLFRAPAVPRRRSDRVRNAFPVPAYGYAYDIATLWLDATEEE